VKIEDKIRVQRLKSRPHPYFFTPFRQASAPETDTMVMADLAHLVAVMHGSMDADTDIYGGGVCGAGAENSPGAHGECEGDGG
jgi:hypothetical protein